MSFFLSHIVFAVFIEFNANIKQQEYIEENIERIANCNFLELKQTVYWQQQHQQHIAPQTIATAILSHSEHSVCFLQLLTHRPTNQPTNQPTK